MSWRAPIYLGGGVGLVLALAVLVEPAQASALPTGTGGLAATLGALALATARLGR